MNRVAELIKKDILRAEKNMFVFRLLGVLAAYVGVTYWLNSVRQNASLWSVWSLIGCQLFLFVTIFVVCSLRLRQCHLQSWWLWFPMGLSRVDNWEIMLIPVATIVTLVLSEKNVQVSQEHQYLLPSEKDDAGVTPILDTSDADIPHQDTEQSIRDQVTQLRRDLKNLEDPETIYAFGMMSLDGEGTPQDYVAASNWFRVAAEQGHAKAQHNLALMYDEGQGVPQDYVEAAKWYRMAAEQGHPGSQNNFAALVEHGRGVAKDYTEAANWYRKAAANGDSNAHANLRRLELALSRENYGKILSDLRVPSWELRRVKRQGGFPRL